MYYDNVKLPKTRKGRQLVQILTSQWKSFAVISVLIIRNQSLSHAINVGFWRSHRRTSTFNWHCSSEDTNHQPTTSEDTNHQWRHQSPVKTPITSEDTNHQWRHQPPVKTPTTSEDPNHQWRHQPPVKTPITSEDTNHQWRHQSPVKTPITSEWVSQRRSWHHHGLSTMCVQIEQSRIRSNKINCIHFAVKWK